MTDPVRNVLPYSLEIQYYAPPVSRVIARPSPRFGDLFQLTVFWRAGGRRMPRPIRVSIAGTGNDEDAFYCPADLFMRAALRCGGEPIFSPPPFATPCTDGLLIIYTLRCSVPGGDIDVHGGYIAVTREELESEYIDTPAGHYWKVARKPVDMATMLKRMNFGETRKYYLN